MKNFSRLWPCPVSLQLRFFRISFSHVFLSEKEATNPYMTCIVARLMGNISKSCSTCVHNETDPLLARVRFQSFYGEDYARLDRLAYRLYEPSSAPSRLLSMGSKLVFGMDEPLTEELNQCFPDRTLIGMVWTKLMTRTVHQWIDSRLLVSRAPLARAIPSLIIYSRF